MHEDATLSAQHITGNSTATTAAAATNMIAAVKARDRDPAVRKAKGEGIRKRKVKGEGIRKLGVELVLIWLGGTSK